MVTFVRQTPGEVSDVNDLNQLQVTLEQLTAYTAKTADYVLTANDHLVAADTSAGAFTLTLPSAVTFGSGNSLTISKTDGSANVLSIATVSAQTVDGLTTFSLYGRMGITLASNGVNWIVTSGKQFVNPERLNVRWFGAKGDGTTDDTVAVLTAYTVAGAVGGGELYFPRGTYLCNSSTLPSGGLRYIFGLTKSNITFSGDGDGSVIKVTTSGAALFFLCGHGKTAGAASWVTNRYVDATVYTMTTAAKGDANITLATVAQAGNFAADDWIFIRTGQTIEHASQGQPDSELNQVMSADAGTGIIVLRWPLSKPYAQEAVDTAGGYTYATKVGGAGATKPFGVANVTDRTITGAVFRNLRIDSTSTYHPFVGGQCHGFTVENCTVESTAGGTSNGDIRHGRILNNRFYLTLSGANYIVAPSTGCTDWIIEGNESASPSHVAYMHAHEGVAQYILKNNIIRNKYIAADINAVSIRARAYDIMILDNIISNAGSGNAIYVDVGCTDGGIIRGNRISGTTTNAIAVNAPNWILSDNTTPTQNVFIGAPGTTDRIGRFAVWVESGAQTVRLGFVPATFVVLRVHCKVHTAFNSDGTDLLTVGHSVANDAYALAIDVSTTGLKTVVFGLWTLWVDNTSREINAYYVNGGSEPTTGKALVIVEYTSIPWRT